MKSLEVGRNQFLDHGDLLHLLLWARRLGNVPETVALYELQDPMRPPICEICDLKFDEDDLNQPGQGGLVEFKPSLEDKAVIARMQVKGWTGHPPNMGWFCSKHIEEARAIRHMSLREAMSILKKKFKEAEDD